PPPPAAAAPDVRAPWPLRLLVLFLSFLAGLLAWWLLGFVLADLGSIARPDRAVYEEQAVDPARTEEEAALRRELQDAAAQLEREQEIQARLEAGIDAARGTLEQMLDIRRLALEREGDWSEAEARALAEAQERFLARQDELEASNRRAADLEARRFDLARRLADLDRELDAAREPARRRWEEAMRVWRFRVAALQLGFLVPVFLVLAWIVARRRRSLLRPLHLALLAAATLQLGAVIHEHFPAEFFKYLALGAGLAVVVAFLVALLPSAARPSGAVLARRNREGYRKRECPRCGFPFRPGAEGGESACPACGLELFRACPACHDPRPAQLPWCGSCGAGWEPAA
ncbi:MAG: zinc ribbon domain-containing protein, partial [Planctomycetota bacterium]